MKVAYWTSLEKAKRNPALKESNATFEVEYAIIKDLADNGWCFSGYYHQNGDYGIPVLDDNTYFLASFRYWGELVAKARGEGAMNYVAYAWGVDDDIEKIPKNSG